MIRPASAGTSTVWENAAPCFSEPILRRLRRMATWCSCRPLFSPGGDLRRAAIVGERQQDVSRFRGGVDLDADAEAVACQPYAELLAIACAGDLVGGAPAIVADECGGAIDHHLRRVGTFAPQHARVALLAQRVGVGGVGVAPSQAVPIIHVFAEDYDLRVERFQQTVRRRTAGAALAGEQFHQDRSAGGFALPSSVDEPKHGQKRDAKHTIPFLPCMTAEGWLIPEGKTGYRLIWSRIFVADRGGVRRLSPSLYGRFWPSSPSAASLWRLWRRLPFAALFFLIFFAFFSL